MSASLPDLDWYVDNVVVPGGPTGHGNRPGGPVKEWARAWDAEAARLRRDRSELNVVAGTQGFVVTRGQVRQAGITDTELRRHLRHGTWTRPRSNAISLLPRSWSHDSGVDSAYSRELRPSALRAAATALVRPESVVSHESAAILHALPVLRTPLIATITYNPDGRSRGASAQRSRVNVHRCRLDVGDVVTWFGVRVTSVARTVTDLARSDRQAGLVAADAALAAGLIAHDQLRDQVDGVRGQAGAAAARWVARHADGDSESPLESLTRARVVDAGLPRPRLQAWIADGAGWRARVDMLWEQQRLILEADGRIKYHDRELWAEKLRQERLERLGYRVVRVLWDDVVRQPDELVARLRWALAETPRRRRTPL